MLAMLSGIEIVAVLVVSAIIFAVVVGGGGFGIYYLIRKAARDGARDAARQQPK
jgi:ABC-type proline/glycine betaine transport system permease subunit